MQELHEYDNDFDFGVLIKSGINKETLLEFIFKKGGKINVTSMTKILLSTGRFKNNLSQSINELISDGLAKCVNDGCEYCSITIKAKWQRIYKSSKWLFWLLVAGIILTLLTLIL